MKKIFKYIVSLWNKSILLFVKNHIMDNTFITNVSQILNNAFSINNIQCTVVPNGTITNHSGTIVFNLPHNPSQAATIEIKVFAMHGTPPKLYFELISCSVLYFPYMAEIWNTLNNSGVRPAIIGEWNASCIRNGQNNKIVNSYY